MNFSFDSNLDFYCFVKHHLPEGAEIQAMPSRSYYSEWHYCYVVTYPDGTEETVAGDFRELQEMELFDVARRILSRGGRA